MKTKKLKPGTCYMRTYRAEHPECREKQRARENARNAAKSLAKNKALKQVRLKASQNVPQTGEKAGTHVE